jgi:hypothetical protein
MTTNEDFIRAAYRTAEGDVLDLEGWRNSFTEDGVFINKAAGESFKGDELPTVVTRFAGLFPDVHREVVRMRDMGDLVVVEVLIQGTFLGGPLPTPAGPLVANGAKVNFPTSDWFDLRDGKIETFTCYIEQNVMFAQLGINPDFASAVAKSAAAR